MDIVPKESASDSYNAENKAFPMGRCCFQQQSKFHVRGGEYEGAFWTSIKHFLTLRQIRGREE